MVCPFTELSGSRFGSTRHFPCLQVAFLSLYKKLSALHCWELRAWGTGKMSLPPHTWLGLLGLSVGGVAHLSNLKQRLCRTGKAEDLNSEIPAGVNCNTGKGIISKHVGLCCVLSIPFLTAHLSPHSVL